MGETVIPNSVLTIFTGLILAGIIWLVRSVTEMNRSLAVLRNIIVGETGDAGVVGEIRMVRTRQHEIADKLHGMLGRYDLLEQRVEALEKKKR